MDATSTIAGRFTLDERVLTYPNGGQLWRGSDLTLDHAVSVTIAPSDVAAATIDAARRASVVEDTRFARIVSTGYLDDGEAYVVQAIPPGTLLEQYESLPEEAARFIIGEVASALETARRRGVQHGALESADITVDGSSIPVISGLSYTATARGEAMPSPDPVEASLARSLADAQALTGLYTQLSGRDLTRPLAAAQNVGEVMRALAPWDTVAVPASPELGHTLWRKIATGALTAGDAVLLAEHGSDEALAAASADSAPLTAGSTATAASAAEPEAAAPAERVLDPSTWTLHPGDMNHENPEFSEILSTDPASLTQDGPRHLGDTVPHWKVYLPGATEKPAVEPAAASTTSDGEQASTEDETTVLAATDAEPADQSGEGTEGTPSDDGLTATRVLDATTIAAAGTESASDARAEDGTDGTHPDDADKTTIIQAAGKFGATAAGAVSSTVSTAAEKLSDALKERDVRIPGEIPTEENRALPIQERRLDPAPFVLIATVAVVVVALIGSVISLLTVKSPEVRAIGGPIISGVERPAPVAPPEPEPTAEAAPAPEAAVTPTISSVAIVDPPPNGDGNEHPELLGYLTDGDLNTVWSSRYYNSATYGIKNGIGLEITLAEPAVVSSIDLHLFGTGGHVQVLTDAAAAEDPNHAVLAEADISHMATVTLPEPTELSSFVLWFTVLPTADSDGLFRIDLGNIAVH